MLDNDGSLKSAIYPPKGMADLNGGESPIIKRMITGQFYSHTGKKRVYIFFILYRNNCMGFKSLRG